jgi:hypothetical protein
VQEFSNKIESISGKERANVRSFKKGLGAASTLIFAVIVLMLCALIAPLGVAAKNAERAVLTCSALHVGGGNVEITVHLESGKLCALAASLEYNSDQFYFVDAKIENTLADGAEKFVLSYVCDGKSVKFIADGVKNTQSGAILARFYFKARRDGAFEFEFRLRGADGICAAAIDGNGRVGHITVDFSRTQGRICTASDVKKPSETKKPTLMRASMEWEGESDCAELVLPIKTEENCLAVGVKAFVVDTETGKYEVYYLVARAASLHLICYGATVRFCVPVAVNGRLCVVLTPLLYVGNGIVEGEKTLFLINDGTICE